MPEALKCDWGCSGNSFEDEVKSDRGRVTSCLQADCLGIFCGVLCISGRIRPYFRQGPAELREELRCRITVCPGMKPGVSRSAASRVPE